MKENKKNPIHFRYRRGDFRGRQGDYRREFGAVAGGARIQRRAAENRPLP
jgi:hypothetical protein